MDLTGFGGGFGNGNGGGGGIAGSAHATKNGSPPSEMSARQASTRTRATGIDGAVFVVENSFSTRGASASVPRTQRAAASGSAQAAKARASDSASAPPLKPRARQAVFSDAAARRATPLSSSGPTSSDAPPPLASVMMCSNTKPRRNRGAQARSIAINVARSASRHFTTIRSASST